MFDVFQGIREIVAGGGKQGGLGQNMRQTVGRRAGRGDRLLAVGIQPFDQFTAGRHQPCRGADQRFGDPGGDHH